MGSKHRRKTRRMIIEEKLVERILESLCTEPLCYGANEFYNYYAGKFSTTPKRLKSVLGKICEHNSNVTRDTRYEKYYMEGVIKYIDTRIDYDAWHKKLEKEPESEPKYENLASEAEKQVEKWELKARAGKRPGAPTKRKFEDNY